MAVYFIRAGEDGPVKIGHAVRPRERRNVVQSYHWMPLQIIRLIKGGLSTEAEMHKIFAANRIRGEWFHFHPDMLTVGEEAVGEYVPPSSQPLVKQIIAKAGGFSAVALRCGTSWQAVARWQSIPPQHFALLSELTGIPVLEMVPQRKAA